MSIEVHNPHALSVWTTVRIDRAGNMETVLVVETDLATSALEDDFHEVAFGALADAIVATMASVPSIDRAEITRIRSE